jgi:hypothetical protein
MAKQVTNDLTNLAFADMLLTKLSKVAGKKETKKQKEIRAQLRDKLAKRMIAFANELALDVLTNNSGND